MIGRNVDDGTHYDVKIRAVNSHKIASDYDEVDNFLASATLAAFGGRWTRHTLE